MGAKMESNREKDELEIDLKDILFELLEHWKMIIFSAVMIAAAAFCISKFMITPQYQSTATLYVFSKSTSITSLTDLQVSSNLTADYQLAVSGRPVLEMVIANLRLNETYATLSKKLSVSNPSDSRFLEITITDPDPMRAKQIADEIAEVSAAYIAEKMDQDPPNVIQYGYADEDPVSPSIGRNTIIGGFLGALLAAALIIISYLLSDTVMTPEDVERKIGIQVLASLPLEEEENHNDRKRHSKKKKKSA